MDVRVVDAVDVKRAADLACVTLAADVVARVVLLVLRLTAGSGNREIAVLVVERDIFLCHAGEIRGQFIVIVRILHIYLERVGAPVRGGEAVAEETVAHRIKESERICIIALREPVPSGKRYQSKHVHQLLEIFWAGSAFGVRPADDILLLWKGG